LSLTETPKSELQSSCYSDNTADLFYLQWGAITAFRQGYHSGVTTNIHKMHCHLEWILSGKAHNDLTVLI